jgi:hypothetical protein
MERWRRIEEAVWYDVSDMGRVRNRRTNRILKPSRNKNGCEKVNLRDADYTITRSVEALRKKAFD